MLKDTTQNPKFRRLARAIRPLLGDCVASAELVAVGILERLWHEAMINAPAGDIGQMSDEDIAEGIGWHGDATMLIDILVEENWLDRCQVHRLVIHKWDVYCPSTVRGNNKKYGREFVKAISPWSVHGASMEPPTQQVGASMEPPAPTGGASNGTSMEPPNPTAGASTVPETVPDPETETETETESISGDSEASSTQKPTKRLAYTEEFEQFWKSYPHRGTPDGKAQTFTEWKRITPADRADMPKAVANYAKTKRASEGFAKDPVRFLKQQTWRDYVELSEDQIHAETLDPTERERLRQREEYNRSLEEIKRQGEENRRRKAERESLTPQLKRP